MDAHQSWGRWPRATQTAISLHWRPPALPPAANGTVLPRGLGRSTGDVCLNDGGRLLCTRELDRFVAFDAEAGTLECEAGVSLGEVLDLIEPRGFFLPVVPGTTQVTVGGAIATDVHGKNHHRAGTFGCHVLELEVLRSSGERITCSPDANTELFRATVGGLGLTGLILRARLRLQRVDSTRIAAERIPFGSWAGFFELAEDSDAWHEFTVAWVDCRARGPRLGRGVFYRGSFSDRPGRKRPPRYAAPSRHGIAFEGASRLGVGAFNALHLAGARLGRKRREVDARSFLFPLDGLRGWDRLRGRSGFRQVQCAIPTAAAPAALPELLELAGRGGAFLGVLKRFGDTGSPGLLSFPREGTAVSFHLRHRGPRTDELLAELHAAVAAHGGRIDLAADSALSPDKFHAQHADVLAAFLRQRDPAFSSSLWRRVNGDG